MTTRNADRPNGAAFHSLATNAPALTLGSASAGTDDPCRIMPVAYQVMLDAQAEQLCQRVMSIQRDEGQMSPAQLREAHDQLLAAALEAVSIAKIAVREFNALVRTSGRDALTGTPDRTTMHDRIEQAASLARRRGRHIAVLFVDLDGFKPINDTLGHAAGDEALRLAARRLQSVVRDSDTVSRHGGDEFLVLLSDVGEVSDAIAVAASMLAALSEPAQVGGHSLALRGSVGVAVFPEDGEDADCLIARADAAMYRAKRCGGEAVRSCRRPPARDGDTRHSRNGEEPKAAVRSDAARELRDLVQSHRGTLANSSNGERPGSTYGVTLPKV